MNPIEQNVAASQAANTLLSLAPDVLAGLPAETHLKFWKSLAAKAAENAGMVVAEPSQLRTNEVAKLDSAPVTTRPAGDWLDVLEQCDEILDLLDDLPEWAEVFATGASELVRSIRKQAEQRGKISDAQQRALDNIQAGAEWRLNSRSEQ